MAEHVEVGVSDTSLVDIGEDLANWLSTIRTLHTTLAGGLVSNPNPVEGSLRSDLEIPEEAAATVRPAYRKEYKRIEILGGFAYDVSANSEDGAFYTDANRFENARVFRARTTTDDRGALNGMSVEAINPDPLEHPISGPNAALGIVIPGNELMLATFAVHRREIG